MLYENILSGFKELSFAVIRQAIDDYKELAAEVAKNNENVDIYKLKMKAIERFFKSQRFVMFNDTKFSGDEIVSMLHESCVM